MRVGRGDGSTDDADVCGLRTVRHTRPEVESMCVHTWVRRRKRHADRYGFSVEYPECYPGMRAASSSEPSHMREGLSG
jgi:hypothetical protein